MSNILTEGNLCFDFIGYDSAERFEIGSNGLRTVDFLAEKNNVLYFIEIKNYRNPEERQNLDMLKEVVRADEHIFALKMGEKIKDSFLRRYAEGYTFDKNVVYLLFINLDLFGETERGLLKAKISGQIPTGLNHSRFSAFMRMKFKIVNTAQLKKDYSIICTENLPNNENRNHGNEER
jgi:hypothetical protein